MKFENTQVFNIEGAMRGMKFPMKAVSDTVGDNIGPKDLDLAQRLWMASENENLAHSKFLRQILVSVDITAPLYFWSEMDTYKVGTTANSESTMHKLLKDSKKLTVDDFSVDDENFDYIENIVIPRLQSVSANTEYSDIKKLRLLKQALPSSYNQKRHWTANYEVIRNIFNQREHHRLYEWTSVVGFCGWASKLPYAEDFIGGTHICLEGVE